MKWTSKKIEYIESNYGILPVKDISQTLGCSRKAVHSKAYTLGLTNSSSPKHASEHKGKIDFNIDYEFGELNAPANNWYALLICVLCDYTIGQSLSKMKVPHDGRIPLIENTLQEQCS